MLTGEPEYLGPLGDETPEGWIVTGYPADLATPANLSFASAYQAKFGEVPKNGSVVGYSLIQSIVAGLRRAGSTETEAMVDGMRGATFETPFGPALYRPQDQQSTMGAFVGMLAKKGGQGIMTQWRYVDGASVLPDDAAVKALRAG